MSPDKSKVAILGTGGYCGPCGGSSQFDGWAEGLDVHLMRQIQQQQAERAGRQTVGVKADLASGIKARRGETGRLHGLARRTARKPVSQRSAGNAPQAAAD